MSLTNIPNDCLLACLARVPYADLRNAIPSTSKQLRDAVASAACRKTRELAGCVEYGVFAMTNSGGFDGQRNGFLITRSAGWRTAATPAALDDDVFFGWCRPFQHDVVVTRALKHMSIHAYNAGQNAWRDIRPLVRDVNHTVNGRSYTYDTLAYHATVGSVGSNIVVLGGGILENYERFMTRMDVYDPAEDVWSKMPDLPFRSHKNLAVEVDGKLYCWGSNVEPSEARRETFVYDPATRTWTNGPRLPYEPWAAEYSEPFLPGFELSKRLCIMGPFILAPGNVRYSAFVWDPTRETWDDFPVPPVMGSVSQMDGHTVVCGRCRSDQPTEQPESRLLGDMRLFVLDAGSRDWVEWDIPDSLPAGVGHPSTRYTAVRIG